MICPNCGHKNPGGLTNCEECGADFGKSSKAAKSDKGLFSNLTTCFTSCLSYFLIAVLIAATIVFVALFNCIFNLPDLPDREYPAIFVRLWNEIDSRQQARCADSGYAEEAEPTEPVPQEIPENKAEPIEEAVMCGQPTIRIEPANGSVGATFTIILEGFSPSDQIEACWFYPSGEIINCAELDADSSGFRKTTFWSETNDPPGDYRMEAKGQCSEASTVWEIGETQ